MKGMAAGKLRHLISIEQQQRVFNGETWVLEWTPIHENVFASIRPVSGKEFIASQEVQNSVDTEIVIRNRENVNPTMRVRYENDIYSIRAVLPDPYSGNQWLTLMATYGVGDGS